MRYTVHPITGETLPVGQEISEPSVLEWIGRAIVRARIFAAARPIAYDWQGGDPA